MKKRILAFGLSLVVWGHNASALTIEGEIDNITNAFFGGNNFLVTLKPHWSKITACSGDTNLSITLAYFVSEAATPETHQRNYSLALAAAQLGKRVRLHSSGGPGDCDDFPYGITAYDN